MVTPIPLFRMTDFTEQEIQKVNTSRRQKKVSSCNYVLRKMLVQRFGRTSTQYQYPYLMIFVILNTGLLRIVSIS